MILGIRGFVQADLHRHSVFSMNFNNSVISYS
jgi:hypothetical protein